MCRTSSFASSNLSCRTVAVTWCCVVAQAQNVLGDNAGLPSPQEAADKVKGAANEIGRKAGGLGDNNPLAGNLPSPQEVRVMLV